MESTFQLGTAGTMLNAFSEEVALSELRETEENKQNGLKELKTLLESEISQIFVPLDNELWLMNFLRVCKFYPESAKERILSYLKMKKNWCEYITQRLSITDVIELLERNVFNILTHRDQLGRRIIVQRIENWPRHLNAYDMLNAFSIILAALRLETITQIHGYVYILDLRNLAMWQLVQMTPNFLKFLIKMTTIQPARLKNYHIVNNPYIFKPIFNFVVKFLPEKFRSRIHLHGQNMNSMHHFIPREYLPDIYGGFITGQLSDNAEFCSFIQQNIKDLDSFENCGYRN